MAEALMSAQKEMEDILISLSYNLGRLEEDAGNIDEAKRTYEGLLKKHPDYVEGISSSIIANNSCRSSLLPRSN